MRTGDLGRAETLARNLLAQVPNLDFGTDEIIHHANLVIGRVALSRGNIGTAKSSLLDAARSEGTPSLSTFGPNMTLAKELLDKGETEVVLQYFELCRKFWTHNNHLDLWIAAIAKNEIPKFDGNLLY